MEKRNYEKIPFEEALNMTGFGLYNYMMVALSGISIIAFACIAYGSTILVPASACELQTTTLQQGALAAAPLIGSIVGALVWGYLGDTRGRRSMLLLCLSLAMFFNTICSISVNWIMLLLFQLVATFMGTGGYTLSVTLLSECVPLAKRNVLLLLVASLFMLSQGIMAVLAIPIIPLTFSFEVPALGIFWNSWRTLILVYNLPSLLAIIFISFFCESPKFLLAKDKEEEALNVLAYIHRVNGFGAKEKTVFEVKGLMKEPLRSGGSDDEDSKESKGQIKPLFTPPLLKGTLIMSCLFIFQQVGAFQVWLPTISNEFVKSLNAGETDSNLCGLIRSAINAEPDPNEVPCAINRTALLIVLGVGCVQSMFNLISTSSTTVALIAMASSFCHVIVVLVNVLGRRTLIMMVTLFCGASGILVNLVPQAIGSGVFFMLFLMGVTVLGLYTAAAVSLFPTSLRALALSTTIAVGRLSSFGVIQLLNYLLQHQCELGFYLFSTIFAASALVALFLPNDKKQMQEAKEAQIQNGVEPSKRNSDITQL